MDRKDKAAGPEEGENNHTGLFSISWALLIGKHRLGASGGLRDMKEWVPESWIVSDITDATAGLSGGLMKRYKAFTLSGHAWDLTPVYSFSPSFLKVLIG